MKKGLLLVLIVFSIVFLSCVEEVSANTPFVGTMYSDPSNNAPTYSIFGAPLFKEDGFVDRDVKKRQGWWIWDKDYMTIQDKYYIVYECDKKVNLTVHSFGEGYFYLFNGVTIKIDRPVSYDCASTYEASASEFLSSKYVSPESLGGLSLYGTIDKVSAYNEVQERLSKEVIKLHPLKAEEDYVIRETLSSPDTINVRYELRACYTVYIVQVYEAVYNVNSWKDPSSWYHNMIFSYDLVGYKLLEQNTKYTLIEGSDEVGVSRYNTMYGKYLFDDSGRNPEIVYI